MTTLQEKARQQRIDRAIKHRQQMVDASDRATDKLITTTAPIAYGYGRISHKDQEDGNSVDAQADRVQAWYNAQLALDGIEWGGFYREPGSVSASKNDFCDRPTGKVLTRLLRPGDHLIVDKVDRLWRSLHDFSALLSWFKSRDINVHFANMAGASVSLNTPMGDFLLGIFVLVAQLEAHTISERTKRALEHGRKQGFWKSSWTPLGCMCLGKKPMRTLEWDWETRADMSKIVELRETEKHPDGTQIGFQTIEHRMEALHRKRTDIPFSTKNRWTYQIARKGYIHEKAFRLYDEPIHVDWSLIRCLTVKDAEELNAPEDLIRMDQKYKQDRRRSK